MFEDLTVLDKIESLLEERNWTLYRLSERSGISQSTLSNLFKRNNAPTLPTLKAICGAFGVSMADFFADGKEGTILTEDQEQLLAAYNQLTAVQKETLIQFLKTLHHGC